MSEEQGTAAAEQDSQASSQGITWENSPVAQIWNPDGSPKDGAQESMASLGHEGIAGFSLRNNQSIFDALKGGKEARASLSQRQEAVEGSIMKPGENSTPEDQAAYREALGALSTPDEYLKDLFPSDLPEGFKKDEELGKFASEWAAKNPVNTPEAMKELAAGVIQLQQSQQATMEEKYLESSAESAKATKADMVMELGGEKQFSDFEESITTYLKSDASRKDGFDFREVEGKMVTNNPLHAAYLNDMALLKAIGNRAKESNPARLPGNQQQGGQGSSLERRQALSRKQLDGSLTTAELQELTSLRH
mgnify:CR=1 FL=1